MNETTSPEYTKGAEAFSDGTNEDSNPFPCGGKAGQSAKRIAWFDGYFDARTEVFLQRLAEKYDSP
jgi:hypothetical protein